jgi:SpoVK/Ycf46/Vps4 family AAA+-type ATPase
MQYLELMFGSMIMNNIADFKTNILWLDLSMLLMILIGVYCMKDHKISGSIKDTLHDIIFPSRNEKRITFLFQRGEQSNRCKGLLHYLSSNNSGTNINHMIEDIFRKYDRYSDNEVESGNIYRVDQVKPFNFTNKIKGRVFTEEKEAGEYNGKVTYKEFIHLVVYSETESLKVLQDFVEKCKQDYSTYLKEQMLENQYLITIENDSSQKKNKNGENENLKISKEEWSSNVTFNSRFFPDKEQILKTIDHFLDNAEWYEKKGLNHTLGILLSGDPGCGKTSFIKALMNYTKRHCIEVKLNDEFNFSDLKDIIYDEEIDDDIVIPQNKRIIVFEDIDAMGNIVKDRNLKEKENADAEDKFKDEIIKFISSEKNSKTSKDTDDFVKIKEKINSKENNNLSYLLNILDGINETPGRIIIMTTNKPEVLDHALIRPGRIDLKINFTKSTELNIKEILYHYWKDEECDTKDLSNQIELTDLSTLSGKITPAEIIDICRKSSSLNESISNMKKDISKKSDDICTEDILNSHQNMRIVEIENNYYFVNDKNIVYDNSLKIVGKYDKIENAILEEDLEEDIEKSTNDENIIVVEIEGESYFKNKDNKLYNNELKLVGQWDEEQKKIVTI